MAMERTDAERRLRQCERLSRLLRVLHYISGPGRWDADALAKELECSRRTIHRLLQTLSLAGVPWYFDESAKAYRIRAGFRSYLPEEPAGNPAQSRGVARAVLQALEQAEAVVAELRQLCQVLSRDDDSGEAKT
jgi:predicted DNA-binding transcriptional regulator YafY